MSGKFSLDAEDVTRLPERCYYRWRQNGGKTARPREDAELSIAIEGSWKSSRQTYGSPRIEQDLRRKGICTSRKRVARLMKDAVQTDILELLPAIERIL